MAFIVCIPNRMTDRNTTAESEAFFSDSSRWLFGGVTPPPDALESAAAGELDARTRRRRRFSGERGVH
jgi:hypothetical protein